MNELIGTPFGKSNANDRIELSTISKFVFSLSRMMSRSLMKN